MSLILYAVGVIAAFIGVIALGMSRYSSHISRDEEATQQDS